MRQVDLRTNSGYNLPGRSRFEPVLPYFCLALAEGTARRPEAECQGLFLTLAGYGTGFFRVDAELFDGFVD